jgi:serine protease AprX
VIVFAAGNEGGSGAQTLSIEANAKNVIAVGSSESTFDSADINYVAYYSSQGPTYDGRIKPDVVSPGDSIMSALSNGKNGPSCSTTEKTGIIL